MNIIATPLVQPKISTRSIKTWQDLYQRGIEAANTVCEESVIISAIQEAYPKLGGTENIQPSSLMDYKRNLQVEYVDQLVFYVTQKLVDHAKLSATTNDDKHANRRTSIVECAAGGSYANLSFSMTQSGGHFLFPVVSRALGRIYADDSSVLITATDKLNSIVTDYSKEKQYLVLRTDFGTCYSINNHGGNINLHDTASQVVECVPHLDPKFEKQFGIKANGQVDFYTGFHMPQNADLIFVRHFLPLNIGEAPDTYLNIVKGIKNNLSERGIIIFGYDAEVTRRSADARKKNHLIICSKHSEPILFELTKDHRTYAQKMNTLIQYVDKLFADSCRREAELASSLLQGASLPYA